MTAQRRFTAAQEPAQLICIVPASADLHVMLVNCFSQAASCFIVIISFDIAFALAPPRLGSRGQKAEPQRQCSVDLNGEARKLVLARA